MEAKIKALAAELERISRELSVLSEALSYMREREETLCDYDSFLSGSSYVVVDSPTGFEGFAAQSEVGP